MNLLTAAAETTTELSQSDKMREQLLEIFKKPTIYIVFGSIILLIIIFYLTRRIVKARPGTVTVIVRKGKVFKLIKENDSNYFMIPVIDSIGATISLGKKSFDSDKLFINNGPEHLYKINYSLEYKVVDPETFYKYSGNFKDTVEQQINYKLREFADNGNVEVLIKNYRNNADDILVTINKAISTFGVEAETFKINYIESLNK